ncbi:DUF72 domain-containing protein [Desemzia sp. FAM 24101]|uniref:DUF72 domain-containing protein n=1 Tax=unclassified Desemzia TaxID=2685243 RepID=UPI00388B236D
MITIGLTGWSDHELLETSRSTKLEDYAGHFPFVELDTSFYAIPSEKNLHNWMSKTPESFCFLPKAYQAMTQHKKWIEDFSSEAQMFSAFLTRFEPMLEQNRIKAFLFQFPPYFGCTKENVTYLRKVRTWMKDTPIAVEFRNSSWYSNQNKEATLYFLKEHQFIHTVVDQPPTPNNSVPLISESTNKNLALLRLHGRNFEGWQGGNSKNWRSERTLYEYSHEEMKQFAEIILELEKESDEVAVIFNNNSGGHAAKNAKELQDILGISFTGLAPRQLDLF